MIYGYARVSTKGQAREGNSLEDQAERLQSAGAVKIFSDSFTGTKENRPGLTELQNAVKSGDTIVITKLDRVARSAELGASMISDWLNRGINVHILNMGLIDNTPMGKLIMHVVFAFAEFERDMIVERTQVGKAIAKKNNPNFREGRPKKWSDAQLNNAMDLLKTKTYREVIEITGISKSKLIQYKRQKENQSL